MLGGAEQCWVCQDRGKIAQNTQHWHSLYCAYMLSCTHTHTHTHTRVRNTCDSFSYELYVLYIRIFSYAHSPPCSIPNTFPPSPLLPRVDSGLLSSFFSYNWLMSSDQLQTTKPSPPTDGKVLRTALKCVEVRLRVCVFVH